MPVSFHSHSGQFCHHATGSLEQVIQSAIAKGFSVYGLSEHMPRFQEAYLYPEEIEASVTPAELVDTFKAFVEEARRLRTKYASQISLLIGMETEYIEPPYAEHAIELRKQYNLDYIVGSVHHMYTVPIDFSKELYNVALSKTLPKANDRLTLFADYFDAQYDMLKALKPEVVAHFDLIRIFCPDQSIEAHGEWASVWQKVTRNIDFVIAYGGLFELNSRAYKKGFRDAYPQRDILQYIQQRNGRFTLSDDSHGPNDVGLYYRNLRDYIQEMHIREIYALELSDTGVCHKLLDSATLQRFWQKMESW
ncbi:hypothetical protein BZG36_00410 [Bifiguratus adelaidae]|uniref:Histidinol-phosphatase n=1 Tax=Bifiguratus adelaidae TaxID=1938954 RepID=A0A261Y810_9FUNG|nr:hypothetical protein BZG36_00410 [Bifiguratus adelaidae]